MGLAAVPVPAVSKRLGMKGVYVPAKAVSQKAEEDSRGAGISRAVSERVAGT